jgi:hypothetical protein
MPDFVVSTAKAKTIMKAKIHAILADEVPPEDAYVRIAQELPDIYSKHDRTSIRLGDDATRYETALATRVRAATQSLVEEQAASPPSIDDDNGIEERSSCIDGPLFKQMASTSCQTL